MKKQILYTGVDISHWQGKIDFEKLSREIDFAILKLGGSDKTDFFYIDKNFEEYYNECKKYKIKTGCYWFAGQESYGSMSGKSEAAYVKAAIKNKSFELPIYLDFEKGSYDRRDANTSYCETFCKSLEADHYFVGIYGSDISTFKHMLDYDKIKNRFSLWVARYGHKPTYATNYDVWQYTSKGQISGITGNVDIDFMYKNLPYIIVSKHFNNC